MPGPYALSPSHTRGESQNSCVDSTRRYSLAPETTAHQLIDSDAHETRKRSRHGDNAAASPWTDYSMTNTRGTDNKSPPPLANERYELAGGMDRPQPFARRDGDYDDYFNLQSQRGTWSIPPTPQIGLAPQPAGGEMQITPNGSKSWSFMSLVGGVAGKLFEFCTVPFRGFQAGGGQKYNIDSHGDVAAKLGLQDDPYQPGPVQQPTPGTFPSDDYGVQSIDSITPDRPRLAKRLRTTDNWIMVGQDCEMDSRPGTPRLSERRTPGHGRSPSQIPRPVSRANAATPSHKRPSLIPVSRRSTVDRRSFHNNNTTHSPATPASSRSYNNNRLSFGSPSLYERSTSSFASPLLAQESQRLIDKVRREELEEDERLRRMSLQMTAMLKEANEALGSKFEVDMFEDEY